MPRCLCGATRYTLCVWFQCVWFCGHATRLFYSKNRSCGCCNPPPLQSEESHQAHTSHITPLPGLDEAETRLLLLLLALAAPSGGATQSLDDAGLRALLLVQLAVIGCRDQPSACESIQAQSTQHSPPSAQRLGTPGGGLQGAWAPPATPSVKNLQGSSVLSFSDLSCIPPRTVNTAGVCMHAERSTRVEHMCLHIC